MRNTCSCCGKPLGDPFVRDLRVGPVCPVARKLKDMSETTGDLHANRAQFSYGFQGEFLWITDDGGLKSVTNDMENILADIVRENKIYLCNYYIIYQDSQGIWDGVRISQSGKITFYPVGVKKMHHAKEKVLLS